MVGPAADRVKRWRFMADGYGRRLLLIDTSAKTGRVGVATTASDQGAVEGVELDGSRAHGRDVTRAIRSLLAGVGCSLSRLAAVAVNTGPGSFTGVRVGMAVAKALVYARSLPLVGVDAFDVAAWPYRPDTRDFYVLIPGQLESILSARYLRNEAGESQRVAVEWHPVTQLGTRLDPTAAVTGPALADPRVALPHVRLGAPPWQPSLSALAGAAAHRYARGLFDDPFALEPHYVRLSSAEEMWDLRPGRPVSG
jgi:tRNA threonylcarbamoyladenosine biosynthesis protein TsaB